MSTVFKWTRRSALTAIVAAPVAGCSSDYGFDYKTIKDSLGVALGTTAPSSISLREAAQVPYSSLGYTLGNSQQSMLILSENTGGIALWTSAQRRALATRSGRIVKSAGFPWNLTDCEFPFGDPVADGLQKPLPQKEVSYICDFADVRRFGVSISAQFTREGPETIQILGQPLQTIAVTEDRRCEEFRWNFQNKFWVDDGGFVWRSVQTIHPNLDPITIEILRPPA